MGKSDEMELCRKRKQTGSKFSALLLISAILLLSLLPLPLAHQITTESTKIDSSISIRVQNGLDTPVHQWTGYWGVGNTTTSESVALDGSSVYMVGNVYYGLSFAINPFIAKLSSSGATLWDHVPNSTKNQRFMDVAVDNESNVIAIGLGDNITTLYDVIVAKYNASGKQLWNLTWDAGFGQDDEGHALVLDSNDSMYIAGWITNVTSADYDPLLLKLNSTGDFQWIGAWHNNSGDDRFFDITLDGNYLYLVGFTSSFGVGMVDVLLVKYDLQGKMIWNVTWGGSQGDVGEGVAVDASHNIYVTGSTQSFGAGNQDAFLVKFNSAGVKLWNITYGTGDNEFGYDLAVDNYGYIHLVGKAEQPGGGLPKYDGTYAIFDSSGAKIWDMTWGTVDGIESGNGIIISANEVYFTGPIWNASGNTYDAIVYRYRISLSEDGSPIPGFQLSWVIFSVIFLLGLPLILVKSKKFHVTLWK